jgi:ribokinase
MAQEGGRWRSQIGGSGFTAAIASAASGAKTVLAGWVGADEADTARELLVTEGVDCAALAVLPGASGRFVVADPADGSSPQPQYRPFESTPQGLPRPRLPATRTVLAFGAPELDVIADGWLDEPDDERTLLWDRQGWISRARDSRLAALVPARHRIWLGNLDEARLETGADRDVQAVASLPLAGFGAALVKAGPWGVLHVTADGSETPIGAYPAAGRWSLGTGDAFAGAVAARLAEGATEVDAARWGCAFAATMLGEPGNVAGAAVGEAARALIEHPGLFVDPRAVETLVCRVACAPTPAGRVLVSALSARLSHLGLRRGEGCATPADVVVADLEEASESAEVEMSPGGVFIGLAGEAVRRAALPADASVCASVEEVGDLVIKRLRERLGVAA